VCPGRRIPFVLRIPEAFASGKLKITYLYLIMALKYRIHDQSELYFVTFTVVNWIDLFIRDSYREIFIDSIKYCQREKGLCVHAWVIMTSHVHMIISTSGTFYLQDTIRDLKRYTSRRIRIELEDNAYESRKEWMLWMFGRAGRKNTNNLDFQLWIQDNHPIQLSTGNMIEQRLEYIHNNPVAAGFVVQADQWKWSSAYDYHCGVQGILDLILLA
jgi:putative transposase